MLLKNREYRALTADDVVLVYPSCVLLFLVHEQIDVEHIRLSARVLRFV